MTNEQAVFLADHYASLMAGEVKTTLKVLGAVRDEGGSYRPDEKSRTAWELATHIAQSDVWFLDGVLNGQFAAGGDAAEDQRAAFKSIAEVLEFYGREVPARLERIRAMSAEELLRPTDFFGLMQWPAVQYLGLANNHGIHHRGQLAAYLRALGSTVPALYGGSADEPFQR